MTTQIEYRNTPKFDKLKATNKTQSTIRGGQAQKKIING